MFSLKDLPRTRLAPLPPKHVLQTSIHSSRSSPEAFFVHHFRVHVADLICFSRAGRGNPFLTYILPLVNSSQLVHVAIEAVAAAHLHVLGTASLVDAERLQLKTLQLLAKYLSNGQEDGSLVEQALAGSLLLIYYEIVLGNSAPTARCHLQGAKGLLNVLRTGPRTSRFQFLCKIFQYFDVMISLSLRERPLGLEDFPEEICSGIDETFGLAGSLWPMMQSLADTLACKREGQDVSGKARCLEQRLQSWSPDQAQASIDKSDVHMEAMLQIARAYKYSSLLTLYSEISPRLGAEDQELLYKTYQSAFDSLLRTCVLSGPMSTLTWPLYTVAILAESSGDQNVVQHIFSTLQNRQHMKVVEMASESVSFHWGSATLAPWDKEGAVFFG